MQFTKEEIRDLKHYGKEIFNSNDMDEAYLRGLKDGQSIKTVLTSLKTISEEKCILQRENTLLRKTIVATWCDIIAQDWFNIKYDLLTTIQRDVVHQEINKMLGRINTHDDEDEVNFVWWLV